MRTDYKSITPTLTEVIQTVIDSNLVNLHTCLPAKIVKYDSKTQSASVLISLTRKFEGSEVPIPWPIISNVPVIFPRAVSGQAYFHLPMVPGDDVTLIVSERSLDNWKQTGVTSDPKDRRRFDMADALAIPGGSASPLAFSVSDALSIELKNLLSFLQLAPTGKITLKNETETLELTGSGTANLQAPLVNVGMSASHGVGLGDVIEARLSALETAFATLTTTFGLHIHNVITPAPGSPVGPPIPFATPFIPVPTPAASLTVKVST